MDAFRLLSQQGFAVVSLDALGLAPGTLQDTAPWDLAARLGGPPPLLLEHQPLRPVPHARGFAGSMSDAPLHTDSQRARGVPARLLVMACVQPAATGGDTVLVDTHGPLLRVHREDPSFFHALAHTPRPHRFYFGAWQGPTLGRHRDQVWFTHAPVPHPTDALGTRVLDWVRSLPRIQVRLRAHQAVLVDNHRMLHGRTAFTDPHRRLVRLLCWTAGLPGPPPPWAPEVPSGVPTAPPPPAEPVPDGAVERMLAGHPPAALCRELGVDEPTLYAARDRLLASPRALDLPGASRFVSWHGAPSAPT